MASATRSVVINRPPADVWRFVADGLNNPRWRPSVIDISLASGAPGAVGAVYKQTMKGPMGGKVAGDYRIAESVEPSRLKFEVIAGPARPTGLFEVAPEGGGARLTFTLSLKPAGLMRLMEGMIQSTMNAEVENLTSLKAALEA